MAIDRNLGGQHYDFIHGEYLHVLTLGFGEASCSSLEIFKNKVLILNEVVLKTDGCFRCK